MTDNEAAVYHALMQNLENVVHFKRISLEAIEQETMTLKIFQEQLESLLERRKYFRSDKCKSVSTEELKILKEDISGTRITIRRSNQILSDLRGMVRDYDTEIRKITKKINNFVKETHNGTLLEFRSAKSE